MAASKRPRRSSKKVGVHAGWKLLAAAYPEREHFMTSLNFGVFLFLFSLFVTVVPASAWMAPIDHTVDVGDRIGRGFETVVESIELGISHIVYLGSTTPLPEEVRGQSVSAVVGSLRGAAALFSTVFIEKLPRSFPAKVGSAASSPAGDFHAMMTTMKHNLSLNSHTLIQSINGRPQYLQRRAPRGLRRYRRQIPLRWNVSAPAAVPSS